MSENIVTIRVTPPSKSAPGFARRLRRAAAFQEKVQAGHLSSEIVDDLIEFLADFCEGEREQVKEYLWEMSELQFIEILGSVSGGDAQVPPGS